MNLRSVWQALAGADPTEQQFLEEMRRHLPVLSSNEREQILDLVRRLASQSQAQQA